MGKPVESRALRTRFSVRIIQSAGLLLLVSASACDGRRNQAETLKAQKVWEDFSGERAFAHVQALVEFGPRPPGTTAIGKAQNYLTTQLESFGWKVTRQAFTDDTPRGQVQFVNLIATFGENESPSSFLVCSHYDTKTFDTIQFVGANDGGSSTGVLLEIAQVFASRPELARKLELVFFDGEEAYEAFSQTDGFYGSRYFAKQLINANKLKQIRGGVVLDMVGDRSLTITLPPDSPPNMASDIFASASALNLRKYFTYFDRGISDDHTALNAAGIPAIDLIDFDFPPWHTSQDTLDKLSPESLEIVGKVVCHYLSTVALK